MWSKRIFQQSSRPSRRRWMVEPSREYYVDRRWKYTPFSNKTPSLISSLLSPSNYSHNFLDGNDSSSNNFSSVSTSTNNENVVQTPKERKKEILKYIIESLDTWVPVPAPVIKKSTLSSPQKNSHDDGTIPKQFSHTIGYDPMNSNHGMNPTYDNETLKETNPSITENNKYIKSDISKESSSYELLHPEENIDQPFSFEKKGTPSLLDLLEQNDHEQDFNQSTTTPSLLHLLQQEEEKQTQIPSPAHEWESDMQSFSHKNTFNHDIRDNQKVITNNQNKNDTAIPSLLHLLDDHEERQEETTAKENEDDSLLNLLFSHENENNDKMGPSSNQSLTQSSEHHQETFLADDEEEVQKKDTITQLSSERNNNKEFDASPSLSLLELLEQQEQAGDLFDDDDDVDDLWNTPFESLKDTAVMTQEECIEKMVERILSRKTFVNWIASNQTDESDDWRLCQEILWGSATSQYTMSDSEWNLILLHTIFYSKSREDRLYRIMSIYQQMKITHPPNLQTYSIILPALAVSCHSPSSATQIILDQIVNDDNSSLFEQKEEELTTNQHHIQQRLVQLILKILVNHKPPYVTEAQKLLHQITSSNASIHPSTCALPILQYYRQEQQSKEALQLLENFCLIPCSETNVKDVEKCLLTCIRWPHKTRDGNRTSTIPHYLSLYPLLSSQQSLSEKVWNVFIVQSHKIAKKENSDIMWKMTRDSINTQFSIPPTNIPIYVMKIGLETAEQLKDSKFIHDIILHYNNSTAKAKDRNADDWDNILSLSDFDENTTSSENDAIILNDEEPQQRDAWEIPIKGYVRAIQLCMQQHDVDHAQQLFQLLPPSISELLRSQLSTSIFIAYTKQNKENIPQIQTLFQKIQQPNGTVPTEKAYAAYIHALAMNRRHEEAMEILNSMKKNNVQLTNASCYQACMVSAMQCKQWKDALTLFEEMQQNSIPLTSSSLYGLLLASYKQGGIDEVIRSIENNHILNDRNKTNRLSVPIDKTIFQLCMKLFLPQIVNSKKEHMENDEDYDIDTVRKALRKLGEDDLDMKPDALDLSRNIRIAQLEEKRIPNKMSTKYQLQQQCYKSWTKVVRSILHLHTKKQKRLEKNTIKT